jgi:hypothetical protein
LIVEGDPPTKQIVGKCRGIYGLRKR